MQKLIFWEMNEINFEYVNFYISKGYLSGWKKFIEKYGIFKTLVNEEYINLEPWIQWPTIRSGKDFEEHGIFRLGDISAPTNIRQHWEILEEKGYVVAAISPINAINKTKKSPFWIPDPWVSSPLSGDRFIKNLHSAIKDAVNENANEKLNILTSLTLFWALVTKSKLSSYPRYLRCIIGIIKGNHWSKAILLDRLLADIFINYFKKFNPDFSVLFTNGGAHIQHHYLFNSKAYKGNKINPESYISRNKDPLLEVLQLYDEILIDLMKIDNARLMIAVAIQQVPFEDKNYYWRLRNHSQFLHEIGIKPILVEPRMTRDFLITFADALQAKEAENSLSLIMAMDGEKIFGEIDNRGTSLFVSLTYSNEIKDNFNLYFGEKIIMNFEDKVAFVAIKNGMHDRNGYFFDTSPTEANQNKIIDIKNIFGMVLDHFKV